MNVMDTLDSNKVDRAEAGPSVRVEGRSVRDIVSAVRRAREQGQKGEAADLLMAGLKRFPALMEQNYRSVYFELGLLLYQLGRMEEAETWARKGVEKQARSSALSNLLGVVLKQLGRYDEALRYLKDAAALDPKNVSPAVNCGNIYIQLNNASAAAEAFARAVAIEPNVAGHRRQLGTAYLIAGEFQRAYDEFEHALRLEPNDARTSTQRAVCLAEMGKTAESDAAFAQLIERFGPVRDLIETHLSTLRRHGRRTEALALLNSLIEAQPKEAWLHHQLARTFGGVDRRSGNKAYEQALALDPTNPDIIMDLAASLDRTRGADEPDNITAASRLAKQRVELGGNLKRHAKELRDILGRVGDYEMVAKMGSFAELGAHWAAIGKEAGLHNLMNAVSTPEQRRQLVDFHRAWGRGIQAVAAKTPIRLPAPAVGRTKIRVGLMSSDLRNHPVGYYVTPIIDRLDRTRFEIFCYSWNEGGTDRVQEHIAARVDGFRLRPDISDRDAAQLIADDGLDMLLELGGSTYMNKIRVMAWRPAPRSASWLGYPHSCGLETIDRIVTDPYTTPADPALLIEKPLQLARTWVAFESLRNPPPEIDPVTPQERNGFVTFGTMNNPWKYSPDLIATWAEAMRGVPDSRFLFVRPEGAVPPFRENMERRFASHGIAPERIMYVAVRGAHLQHYNAIDVALDTFPHTGGTTTCETIWMGVPVIALVGEALFERMSFSNLSNAGLADLCAFTKEDFVKKAVDMAGATAWRTEFRRTARERIRAHPLGQPEEFARDFQDALLRWMDEPLP
jgi:predicted O-linked N-acetylglucosamine transferase (SPINDLY family)